MILICRCWSLAGGGDPRTFGRGEPSGPPNPDHISDQNISFLNNRIQTQCLKSISIFKTSDQLAKIYKIYGSKIIRLGLGGRGVNLFQAFRERGALRRK